MFITLFTTLTSFLAGSLPRALEFFQDRSDKKHEIELMKLSTERELELAKAGFDAKAKIEEYTPNKYSWKLKEMKEFLCMSMMQKLEKAPQVGLLIFVHLFVQLLLTFLLHYLSSLI